MHDLILQGKLENLLNNYIYPTLFKFPKAEKFALCQEIKQTMYDSIKLSIEYQRKSAPKRNCLYKIDDNMKYLLVLVRTASKQRYISVGKTRELQVFIS